MKKRILALFMAVVFAVVGFVTTDFRAEAEEAGVDVDRSEIMTDGALIGYADVQTWGVYLVAGDSIINDAGGGKIGCGGTTMASTKCSVSVNSIVERKVNGSWTRVTSWVASNPYATIASISKTLSVGSGYYYRVRSIHTAKSDGSSSYTGALWM